MQFHAVQENARGELSLSLIADVAATFEGMGQCDMVSCLSLPPPTKSGSIFDWVVMGDSDATLYGFGFELNSNGGIEIHMPCTGRFRTNTHDTGVPIAALVATYGSGPHVHHKPVQAKGVSYSLFLNSVLQDERGFYSVGENGKLLTWKLQLHNGSGWKATADSSIPALLAAQRESWRVEEPLPIGQIVAGHSSRLVPHVIVMVDAKQKKMICFDRTKTTELPPEFVCSYIA